MVTSLGYTNIIYIYYILSRQVLWLFSWSELSCWPRCSLGLLSTWPISSPSLRLTHGRGLREVSLCVLRHGSVLCAPRIYIFTQNAHSETRSGHTHTGAANVFHKNLSELSSVTEYIIYVYIVYITAEHPVAVALSCFCVSSSVCVCVCVTKSWNTPVTVEVEVEVALYHIYVYFSQCMCVSYIVA